MRFIRSKAWPAGLAMLAAVAVVAGCAGETATPASPGASPAIPGARAAPYSIETIKSNLPADFQIQVYRGANTLGGDRVDLSQVVAQGKPVALNFFAGLCPPCRAEIPDLQEVHNRLGDRFTLVGVDVGPFTGLGTNDDGLELIEDLDVTFPTGSTPSRDVVNRYRILGMPSTVFITPDGKVLRKWDGALSQSKLEELVQQLITAASSS